MKMQNYVYDAKFQGNVLVVGRTNCGKTDFLQKLAVNNFFGKLVQVEWVSKLNLDKKREAEIQSCFDCAAKSHYPEDKNELHNILEQF